MILNIYSNLTYIKPNILDKNIKANIVNLEELDNVSDIYDNDYIFICGPIKNKDPNDFVPYLKMFKKNRAVQFNESPMNYKRWYEVLEPHVDFVFSQFFKNDIHKHFWTPYHHFLCWDYNKNEDYDFKINSIDINKKIKYMCNNPILINWKERLILIDKLSKEDIDIYGGCNELSKYGTKYKGILGFKKMKKSIYYTKKSESKIHTFKDYKFVVVIENCFHFGSVTEKLVDVLGCLSVPVYFGSYYPEKILPELFTNGIINGFNFKTIDDLLYYLKNMSDDEYIQRIETIKKHRESCYQYFTLGKIQEYCTSVFLKKYCKNIPNPYLTDINNKLKLDFSDDSDNLKLFNSYESDLLL